VTNIKFFKFVKKDVMIDDIKGFFEVHKQGRYYDCCHYNVMYTR